MAGPTNADAPQVSMRWQYGLALGVDPRSIGDIQFSCEPIPGTTFSAKGGELKRMKDGTLFVEGPILPVSRQATPWLFENSITSANCRATISSAGQRRTVISTPVSFSAATKAATVEQLKMAHEFNTPARR